MNTKASERLIQLVPKDDPSFPGISREDIARIQVDEKVKSDILSCLYDVENSEVGWGLWFCEALLKFGKLDPELMEALIERLPSLLKREHNQTRAESVFILVMLRDKFPEFRAWMLQSLRDHYPTVREHALLNSQTFLKPREIEPLLAFKNDDYLTETSMGSPLVYLLRNEALERIEKTIAKTFERKQLSEVVDGGETAYWWDWTPFLEWREKQSRKWRFWRRRAS